MLLVDQAAAKVSPMSLLLPQLSFSSLFFAAKMVSTNEGEHGLKQTSKGSNPWLFVVFAGALCWHTLGPFLVDRDFCIHVERFFCGFEHCKNIPGSCIVKGYLVPKTSTNLPMKMVDYRLNESESFPIGKNGWKWYHFSSM